MEDLDSNIVLEMLWDDRAMRPRLARRKKNEAVEKHQRKLELEEMADHLKDVLMTRLFDMLNKETIITLMDSSGIMTSRRMQSIDDRRTLMLDMAREWLSEVVCQRVIIRDIVDIIRDSNNMTADGSVQASMVEEVMKGMEMLPTPNSVQWLPHVEVGMGLLSLSTQDVCGGDQEMADVMDDAATLPETEESMLSIVVPMDVQS